MVLKREFFFFYSTVKYNTHVGAQIKIKNTFIGVKSHKGQILIPQGIPTVQIKETHQTKFHKIS